MGNCGSSKGNGTVAVPVVAFALGVVEHPSRPEWALVHEKQTRGWWLPGGGIFAASQTLLRDDTKACVRCRRQAEVR